MKNFIRIIIASAIFAVAVPAHANIDLLLLIPGVEGFSNVNYDPEEPSGTSGKWNKLKSFNAGYDQDGCSEVTIEMGTNAAVAQIIGNGLMGASNPKIYLHAVGQDQVGGGGLLPHVYYTLNDAVIISAEASGAEGDDVVSTTLQILPTSITVEYFSQTGEGGGVVSFGPKIIPCSDKKKKFK